MCIREQALSNPLAKLQLIKGWLSADGVKHNKVLDLLETDGATQLCTVYQDPDYDPANPTYYYLRAVETSSPRWSKTQCDAINQENRPDACKNEMPDQIFEMAWTSPIWLTPDYISPIPADNEFGLTKTQH